MSGLRIVIPARYDSQRLPGKPVADIHGLPMVVRTAQSAARSNAKSVVVATDDQRVFDVATQHGIDVEMTSTEHPSGTDRLLEVAEKRAWSDDELVINVQGDEPLVPAAVITQLAQGMADSDLTVGTLCEPIEDAADVHNPNIVKVIRDRNNRAIYFSRAPIPYARDQFASPDPSLPMSGGYLRHIGIYAYRVGTLRTFVALGPSQLEQTERLEQLRLLDAGIGVLVLEASERVPGGVDTEEDLEMVRAIVATGSQEVPTR